MSTHYFKNVSPRVSALFHQFSKCNSLVEQKVKKVFQCPYLNHPLNPPSELLETLNCNISYYFIKKLLIYYCNLLSYVMLLHMKILFIQMTMSVHFIFFFKVLIMYTQLLTIHKLLLLFVLMKLKYMLLNQINN